MGDITPKIIFVFSGKRKSGKDYVTSLLQNRFGSHTCVILRLSGPLKAQYAKDHKLNYDRLLDATEYKEKYRADMIKWGESIREKDPGHFCKLAIREVATSHNIWIVSDARRRSDVKYFRDTYPNQTVTVRVEAEPDVRQQRGFIFQEGIDDAPSECGLDTDVSWDVIIKNNGDQQQLERELQGLEDLLQTKKQTDRTS